MSADVDHTVLELQRGRRGKLVISRATFQGGPAFTKLVLWYPDGDADDAPLKRGATLTIRDHELAQVITVLIAIDKKQFTGKAAGESFTATTPAAAAAHRAQHTTIRATDDDERGLF